MRRLIATAALVGTLALSGAAVAAPFKNFQATPTHTGHHSGDSLPTPLAKAWSRDLGGSTSYPVVVDGRIFVTVANRGYSGTSVVALDAHTGRTLWSHALAGNYRWSNAAYANGILVVLADTGWITGYDPATGAAHWTRRLGDPFATPPTGAHGLVYASTMGLSSDSEDDGRVWAIDPRTGHSRWTRVLRWGSTGSAPTVGRHRLFENFDCGQVYALDRAAGATAWHLDSGCFGRIGATTELYRGRLWTRESYPGEDPIVFDAASGRELRHFAPTLDPAFAGGIGFFPRYPGIEARSATTNRLLWRKDVGSLMTTPALVVGDVVYAGGENGHVYGFDRRTGTVRVNRDTGAPFAGAIPTSGGSPTSALGAGAGLLVVPNGRGIHAYRSQR